MSATATNDPLHFVLESANSAQQQQLSRQAKRIEELQAKLADAIAQIGVLSGQREVVVRERMTARVIEATPHSVHLVVDDADAVSRLHIARQRFAPGREVKEGEVIFIDTIGSMDPVVEAADDAAEQDGLRADLARIGAALEKRSLRGPVQL